MNPTTKSLLLLFILSSLTHVSHATESAQGYQATAASWSTSLEPTSPTSSPHIINVKDIDYLDYFDELTGGVWTNEDFKALSDLVLSLKRILQSKLLIDEADEILRQIDSSEPYIKNRQYVGQTIKFKNKDVLFIFFFHSGGHVTVANIGTAPLKEEKKISAYLFLHRSLRERFTEIQDDVFDIGNGYYAFINEYDKHFNIQILKPKNNL